MSDYIDTREGWHEVDDLGKARLIEYSADEYGMPVRGWVREKPLPTEFPREEAEAIIYRLLAASMNVTTAADLALDRLATLWEKRA